MALTAPVDVLYSAVEGRNTRKRRGKREKVRVGGRDELPECLQMYFISPLLSKIYLSTAILLTGALCSSLRHPSSLLSLHCPPPLARLAGSR